MSSFSIINEFLKNNTLNLTAALGSIYLAKKSFNLIFPKSFKMEDIEDSLHFKYRELKINPQISPKYLESLKLFINTISKNPSFDLTALSRNLPDLLIYPSLTNFLTNSNATYNCSNVIKTKYNDYLLGIYHEYFHMLSTISTKEATFMGFSLYIPKKKLELGDGLNEGYTELLNYRYFKDYCQKEKTAYDLLVLLMKHLEIIIGEKEMEHLYSKASLYGLINELRKYTSDLEIKNFIINMDKIYKFYNLKLLRFTSKDVSLIVNFLIVTYSKKIYLEYKQGKNSYDIYTLKLKNYLESLNNSLDIKHPQNYILHI